MWKPAILQFAYHEAGHAALAVHHGVAVSYAAIITEQPGGGGVVQLRYSPSKRPGELARHQRMFHVDVAGYHACRLLTRADTARCSAGEDFRNARERLELAFPGDPEKQRQQFPQWGREAEWLVMEYSPAIVALAAALLKHRRLSGRTVRRIIRSMPLLRDCSCLRPDNRIRELLALPKFELRPARSAKAA